MSKRIAVVFIGATPHTIRADVSDRGFSLDAPASGVLRSIYLHDPDTCLTQEAWRGSIIVASFDHVDIRAEPA